MQPFAYKRLLLAGLFLLPLTACDRIDTMWDYYKHGDRIQMEKMTFFYKSPVTREEVTKLGNYLNKQMFDYESDSIAVKILKSDERYELYFITKKGVENDETNIRALELLGDELSRNIFQYSKTDIHMTDDNFETVRVVPCRSCYTWVDSRKRIKRENAQASKR